MAQEYTVIVGSTTFILSEEQVHFDSPNYFTKIFFGEFVEAESRKVILKERNAELFHYVILHLSGENIKKALTMKTKANSKLTAQDLTKKVQELIEEAQYFMLSHFESLLLGMLPSAFICMNENSPHIKLSCVENLSDLCLTLHEVETSRIVNKELEYRSVRIKHAQLCITYAPNTRSRVNNQRPTYKFKIILRNSHQRSKIHECRNVTRIENEFGFPAQFIQSVTQRDASISWKKDEGNELALEFNSGQFEQYLSDVVAPSGLLAKALLYTGTFSFSSTGRKSFDLHIVEALGFWYEGGFNILSARLKPVNIAQDII